MNKKELEKFAPWAVLIIVAGLVGAFVLQKIEFDYSKSGASELGTIIGRVQISGMNEFIQDPSATDFCSNGTPVAGFSLNFGQVLEGKGGDGASTTAHLHRCNPQPYFSVDLPAGEWEVKLNTPSGWEVAGSNPVIVTVEPGKESQPWFTVRQTTFPKSPGTLTGRVKIGEPGGVSEYAEDPTSSGCSHATAVGGFLINFTSEDGIALASAKLDRCNPQPYYIKLLNPGVYTVSLTTPEGWAIEGHGTFQVKIESGRTNTVSFAVNPVIVIPPPPPR